MTALVRDGAPQRCSMSGSAQEETASRNFGRAAQRLPFEHHVGQTIDALVLAGARRRPDSRWRRSARHVQSSSRRRSVESGPGRLARQRHEGGEASSSARTPPERLEPAQDQREHALAARTASRRSER
jgi:hypothetical protein